LKKKTYFPHTLSRRPFRCEQLPCAFIAESFRSFQVFHGPRTVAKFAVGKTPAHIAFRISRIGRYHHVEILDGPGLIAKLPVCNTSIIIQLPASWINLDCPVVILYFLAV